MKKTIKVFVLLALISIPTWILLDNIIIRKLIISSLEKATKKEVHLEKLNINYFPNIKIELINLKIPNPYQDNYLIIAENLFIDIETNALLQKSLIINNISSNKATLMDSREQPIKIIVENSNQNSKNANISSTLKKYLETSLDIYNDSEIKSTIESTFDFNNEINDLETIINSSTSLINEKKDNVLKQTTNTLYRINNINIDTIQNIDQLNETQKTMKSITQDYESITKEINDIENIYQQSDLKIKEINNNLNKRIDESFSFQVITNNASPSANELSQTVKNILSHLLTKFRQGQSKKTATKFSGITYNFRKNNLPMFLIRKIEINTFNDDHYFKGLNLTTSKHNQVDLKLYLKLFNQNKFDKLIVNLSSPNNHDYEVNVRARNIHLNQTKLYETEDIVVNFLSNKTTDLDISGTLSTSSNIITTAIIKKPNYRVISKKTTPHFLTSFIPYLNNQDISLEISLNGKVDDLSVNVTTNLDPLIKNIQNRLLDKKMVEIKKQKQRKINQIKEEQFGETNKKSTEFSKEYTKTLNQLKFQEKEIFNQKELIQRRINQKKVQVENAVMGELNQTIKKINLNGLSN